MCFLVIEPIGPNIGHIALREFSLLLTLLSIACELCQQVGAALRELRAFLRKADPDNVWAGLEMDVPEVGTSDKNDATSSNRDGPKVEWVCAACYAKRPRGRRAAATPQPPAATAAPGAVTMERGAAAGAATGAADMHAVDGD